MHKIMVFSKIILGFIISKEGKTLAPKKIEATLPTSSKDSNVILK
jgi:hypothetical protein